MTVFDKVLEYVKSDEHKPELVFVDYDEELTDEQVRLYVNGSDEAWCELIDKLSDFEAESRHYGVKYEMEENLPRLFPGFDPNDIDLSQEDELKEAIEESDSSNWLEDLVRNTPAKLFQVDLEVEAYGAESDDDFRGVLKSIGLEPTPELVSSLRSIKAEQFDYLCQLNLVVYMDIEKAKMLNRYGGTISDSTLAMIDPLNGTCNFEYFPAAVTVPHGRVYLDSVLGYGSVDNICGVVEYRFEADVKIDDGVE